MCDGGFGVCGLREGFCFTWVTPAFAVKIGRVENVKKESNCGCNMWQDPFGAALHLWSTISFSLPPQFKRFHGSFCGEIIPCCGLRIIPKSIVLGGIDAGPPGQPCIWGPLEGEPAFSPVT